MYDFRYFNGYNAISFRSDFAYCHGYSILYFYSFENCGTFIDFFIVTFSLPINLPIAPEEALYRGFAIILGGILATLMVLVTIFLSKTKAEEQAIQNDFTLIKKLLHHYNEKEKFFGGCYFSGKCI